MTGGPRSKDGGFDLTIDQRRNGGGFTALRIAARANVYERDDLTLTVYDETGNVVHEVVTER